MHDKSVAELARGLRDKQFSSAELSRCFLDRIRRLDKACNSFVTVDEDAVLAAAAAADARIAAGQAAPLTGIPIAHKDIFCTEGLRSSCGSRMLDNFVPPYSATLIENFNRDGCVILGKTNMDEFAMGSSNENSYYGAVNNPWAAKAVPGGSSGGSAAAVAARLVPIATGTDTGGSIRQPAAFCNLTGIKPTYGRVSRWGMVAYASSLDQAGVLARSAEDAALLLQAIAGFDPRDSTSTEQVVADYLATLDQPLQGLRIGLPQEYFGDGLNAEISQHCHTAIELYQSLGASVQEVSLPTCAKAIPAYYIVAPAEASSNLARFDGVRYGYRCSDPKDLLDLYTRSRGEGFGSEVQRRIMVGTYALSAGYYDAYYRKAQQIRRLIRDEFMQAFNKVDVLMGPTTPTPAFDQGAMTTDPVTMYLNDIYTVAINLAGLPAMSVPVGMAPHNDNSSRPVGLQLIGPYFGEQRLLNIAHQLQQNSDWHQTIPPGFDQDD